MSTTPITTPRVAKREVLAVGAAVSAWTAFLTSVRKEPECRQTARGMLLLPENEARRTPMISGDEAASMNGLYPSTRRAGSSSPTLIDAAMPLVLL